MGDLKARLSELRDRVMSSRKEDIRNEFVELCDIVAVLAVAHKEREANYRDEMIKRPRATPAPPKMFAKLPHQDANLKVFHDGKCYVIAESPEDAVQCHEETVGVGKASPNGRWIEVPAHAILRRNSDNHGLAFEWVAMNGRGFLFVASDKNGFFINEKLYA